MVGRDDLPRDPRGPDWLAAFNSTTGDFLDAFAKDKASARRALLRAADPTRPAGSAHGAGHLEAR
jgi:hypothetical protein